MENYKFDEYFREKNKKKFKRRHKSVSCHYYSIKLIQPSSILKKSRICRAFAQNKSKRSKNRDNLKDKKKLTRLRVGLQVEKVRDRRREGRERK